MDAEGFLHASIEIRESADFREADLAEMTVGRSDWKMRVDLLLEFVITAWRFDDVVEDCGESEATFRISISVTVVGFHFQM